MNVGDYMRIDGYISKIEHMKTSSSGKTYVQWKQPNGLLANANIKLIEKSSPQIIDLIDYEDVVKIIYHGEEFICKVVNVAGFKGVQINLNYSVSLNCVKIKTIVTHEQMETMQYRVEE